MGKPYTARQCRVAIQKGASTAVLLASRVTVRTNTDRIDVSNFESGADTANDLFYGDYLAGITSATVTIELFDSDGAVAGYDHWAAGLKSGVNEGKMWIYLKRPCAALTAWYFPILTVIDISSDNEVHGAIKSMITVMNRGRFYYPGEDKGGAALFGNS